MRLESLDVVPVAVELVGLDQVDEHNPSESERSSAVVEAIASTLVAPGCLTIDADAGEQVADLADTVDREPSAWSSSR